MRYPRCILVTVVLCGTLAGCPPTANGPRGPVRAVIDASQTSGRAPLSVTFSARGSSSTNGGPLTYAWDFGDGDSGANEVVVHSFTSPGRYIVTLTVTDPTGAAGTTSVEIRAQGGEATAVIRAEPVSGVAPLLVSFDGTGSTAPDDVIRDYHWDFGDGQESREPAPRHAFTANGEYLVTLRVVSAGGVEATATQNISVAKRSASLQFNGTDSALLPVIGTTSFTSCTFELWFKVEQDGGTLVSLGSGVLTVDARPSSNSLRLQLNGTPIDGNVTNLAGQWRRLAVVFDSAGTGTCTLYLDGAPLASTRALGVLVLDRITLGPGLRGNLADARFWNGARSAASLNNYERTVGDEPGLIGYWPINEGSGQTLRNRVLTGTDGTLGTSSVADNADPAWSTDGPPV